MPPVYFLGAGATKADYPDAPLGDELLHVILRDGLAADHLLDFLAGQFEDEQLDPNSAPESRPRLDDVFTLLDAPIRNRAPYPPGVTPSFAPQIRQALVMSMGQALNAQMPGLDTPVASAFGQIARREGAVIISTNYDIAMDNALFIADRPNVNYGVTIRAQVVWNAVPAGDYRQSEVRHLVVSDTDGRIRTGDVRLLKLHGSLNWLYCPRCDELDVFLGVKAAVNIMRNPRLGRCAMEHCTGRYEPLLIGPSLEQHYTNRILRESWQNAERALGDADRLVFIGYSMPDADYLIRSMVSRHFSRRSTDVLVVLKGNQQTAEAQDLRARYARLFPRATFRWGGFEGVVREAEV